MWHRIPNIMRYAGFIIASNFLFNGIICNPLAAADDAEIDASALVSPSFQSLLDTKESNFLIQAAIVENYGKLPLSFEVNNGQVNKTVKFLSRGNGYTLFLTSNEVVLSLRRTSVSKDAQQALRKSSPTDESKSAAIDVIRLKSIGANPNPKITGLEELPGKSHYFIGNDPAKWCTNISGYEKIKLENVYPGIDLVYYGNQGKIEFDFVVSTDAEPGDIELAIEGAEKINIDAQGDLVVATNGGEVRFQKPVVYQEKISVVNDQSSVQADKELRTRDDRQSSIGNRQFLNGRYILKGHRSIAFEVASYDPSKPLVIDPVLSYSTYLGGAGFDVGRGIVVDNDGNAYVTGETSSTEFPTTPRAYDATCGTSADCNWDGVTAYSDTFVTKLSADGSSVVYSTFLGGSDQDIGMGIALDTSGNAYVYGKTSSDDFPVTPGAYQLARGGGVCGVSPDIFPCPDAFVAKLNGTGSSLDYSTYLGGSSEEDIRGASIAVDTSGNAYVAGRTNSSDFPTENAIQSLYAGGTCGTEPDIYACSDGFVAKIDPFESGALSLVYSTYLGGDRDDGANAIAVDFDGNAYVTGIARSADFPTTDGAYQIGLSGWADSFVMKIDAAGSAFAYSTLLGGTEGEAGTAIAVDASGNAYLTGWTMSTDFPATPGTLDTGCGTDGLCNGDVDGFVTKLNAAGSQLDYSTYLGGSRLDIPLGIAVDSLGIAYVAGYADSPDFPLEEAIRDYGGGICGWEPNTYPCPDPFMAKLSPNAVGLIFATYLGSGGGQALGLALDSSRDVYMTGLTWDSDFPTTPGAYDTSCGVDGVCDGWIADAFIVKLSRLVRAAIFGSAESIDFGEQSVGSTSEPRTVTYTNIGDASQQIPLIEITGDFNYAHNCGTSIPPGTSCTVDFTFTPREVGSRTGWFQAYDVEDDDWDTVLSLSGTGIAPNLSITPASLSFPSQQVGSTSDPQTVEFENLGNAPLIINSLTISREFAQTNDCGSSITKGERCTFWITFIPRGTGTRTGTLTISSDAPDGPHWVALKGSGFAPSPPQVRMPRRWDFGLIRVGEARTVPLPLNNVGGQQLEIRRFDLEGPFLMRTNCGPTLEPGNGCTILVTFIGILPPRVSRITVRSSLSVYTNASGSPHRVALRGEVRR